MDAAGIDTVGAHHGAPAESADKFGWSLKMCLQCTTEAVVYGEILPGFILMRATKDDIFNEWNKGELGLVEINNPTFIIKTTPLKDPGDEATDNTLDAFLDSAVAIEQELLESSAPGAPVSGAVAIYRLLDAATKADPPYIMASTEANPKMGVKSRLCGKSSFGIWISDRIARWLESHSGLKEDDLVEPPSN